MCNESRLATLFGQFAGREMAREGEKTNDPVYNAMSKLAKNNGYRLHLIWGSEATGAAPTADHNPKRATVHMERHRDGTWHVGTHYHAG